MTYRGAVSSTNTPSIATRSTSTGKSASSTNTRPPADARFSGMTVSVAR